MKETDYAEIVTPLLAWYGKHARELPWRETADPYRIWVSEIMLQQTRVEAVKGYYERFLSALPDVGALAHCPEEKLLKLWEGLGYYSRVKNLQKAAQNIMNEWGGKLPADHDALLKLPGIGPYTAAAIASIAFGIPRAVVDGNVLRVCTRLTANDTDITDPAFRRQIAASLDDVIPKDAPGTFNQAMMDLGAVICTPNGNPQCMLCPLRDLCKAHQAGEELSYPVKSKGKARKIEKMTVFLLRDSDRYAIRKRKEPGLLSGFYELPHTAGWLDEEAAVIYLMTIPVDPMHISRIEDAKHIFTHKEWHMIAYEVRIAAGSGEQCPDLVFASAKELKQTYPLPSAFAVYKKHIGL
ncbi:MAG: A/G-specific adenine glycosylase [Lachnospiraceae bacterium]|nr:A/G-specific adenine glycosylase [Lachnospiraceae bacterium]